MDSGGVFFLMRHTPNEVISGEKALITFLSNLYGPLSVHCLDYRPILGFGFVNGGFEMLWCEYLWVAISPRKLRNMKCSRSDFRSILGLLRVSS